MTATTTEVKATPKGAELFPLPDDNPDEELQFISLHLIEETDAVPSSTLVASIRQQGLSQPILLNRPVKKDGLYTVVDGKRRLTSFRKIGLTHIPALVQTLRPERAAALTVTANTVRDANPIDEYRAIEKMLEAGMDEDAIFRATGMPKQTIRKRMQLSALPKSLRDQVRNRKLNVTVAEAMAKLPTEYINQLTDTFADKGKLTLSDVAEVQKARREGAGAALPAALFPAASDDPLVKQANGVKATKLTLIHALTDSERDWAGDDPKSRKAYTTALNKAIDSLNKLQGRIQDKIDGAKPKEDQDALDYWATRKAEADAEAAFADGRTEPDHAFPGDAEPDAGLESESDLSEEDF